RVRPVRGGVKRPPVLAVADRRDLPLSFAQQRLWFLDQLAGAGAYGIPVAARLDGPLDRRVMAATIELLAQRHESLRTVFTARDGKPVQQITPGDEIRLRFEDLSRLGTGDVAPAVAEAEMERRLEAESRRPFDLEVGPLFRAQLYRITATRHILALQMHHIISDGWSMEILISELRQIYHAFAAGRPSPLEPPRLHYADYAVWQREVVAGEALQADLDYWTAQLDGARPLELPTDRSAPKPRTSRGGVVEFEVDAATSAELVGLGRSLGATPFMTLLAAYQVLLARYTGSRDVVVATPVANRGVAEVEKLVGFFVNTLALRTRIDEDASFRDLLSQVRGVTLDAWAHQDLPFDRLMEALRPGRGAGALPFQQAVFTLGAPSLGDAAAAGGGAKGFGGLELHPLPTSTRS
ncbi:MAG: condensation domain-containing protein, partial [Acidobacteriota bacterium]